MFFLRTPDRLICFFFLLTGGESPCISQLTPPGFDHTRLVSWEAVGLSQDLDSLDDKQVRVYTGLGRESQPDDLNLYEKPGIWVLEGQYREKITPRLAVTTGLSYRLQHRYSGTIPYQHELPGRVNEIRFYGILTVSENWKHLSVGITMKQEARTFVVPAPYHPNPAFQLRTRLKTKLQVPVWKHRDHRVIFSQEVLFPVSFQNGNWEHLHYSDLRLSLYYSVTLKKLPLLVEVGYMNELRGLKNKEDISFFAMDLVWINPFKH